MLNTTGIVRVAPWAALAVAVPKPVMITSGLVFDQLGRKIAKGFEVPVSRAQIEN